MKKLCCSSGSEAEEMTGAVKKLWLANKGLAAVIAGLVLLLIVLASTTWTSDTEFLTKNSYQADSADPVRYNRRYKETVITVNCSVSGNPKIEPTCRVKSTMATSILPAQSPASNSQTSAPTCPEYFRYIHEDLKPWKAMGITREMVESVQKMANFRLVVLDGRIYMEQYSKAFQTRDVFTLWGIIQLLNLYPGRVPDLDLMFNCDDMPMVKASDYPPPTAPPPLFRYCKDDATVDIVFPDWSFWGWSEINIKPWKQILDDIQKEKNQLKWKDRQPYAYWKGNPNVAGTRWDLVNCNVSNGHEWNVRAFTQDWELEIKNDFKQSNIADQCNYRYKIYIEGRSWSVSEKYIFACDSPVLLVSTPYQDFFSRGLFPGVHYWPIDPTAKCRSIKLAVDWGNAHPESSMLTGAKGSGFTFDELGLDNVYDYMLHLLDQYAALLKYKPTVPERATEICLESMACGAKGKDKEFMMESMVTHAAVSEPCVMPPPFEDEELVEIARRKDVDLMKIIGKDEG